MAGKYEQNETRDASFTPAHALLPVGRPAGVIYDLNNRHNELNDDTGEHVCS